LILEQISWAAAIDDLSDAKAINRIKAEGSIPTLKAKIKFAGALYGWLSLHTHWRYDGHMKAMVFAEDTMSATLQSSRFKAISLSIALLVLALTTLTLKLLRPIATTSLLSMQPETRLGPHKRIGDPNAGSLSVLLGMHNGPSIEEIGTLLALSLPLALIDEIKSAGAGDKDIDLLWNMAAELRKATGVS
jgi:hypothetical protein